MATDDKGRSSVQAFTLIIHEGGGTGGAGGGNPGSGGNGGFAGGDIGEGGGTGGTLNTSSSGEGGYDDTPIGPRRCSCRLPGSDTGEAPLGSLLVALLLIPALRRRERRR